MKNHHWLALGLVALSAMPATVWADDKPPAADKKSDSKPGKPGHDGTPGMPGMRGRDGMPAMRNGGPGHAEKRDGGAAPGAHEDARDGARDGGAPGRGAYKNAVNELFQELKAGKLKKDELKQKLSQLRDTSGERKKEHREELGKRWGAVLAKPPAREELKVHARRMAFLNRALLLAQGDTKPDKDKTVERITKLIDKENSRHDRAMARIQSQPSPAASAQPTVAAPAASDVTGGSK
ncbi:MAG TPA: hypothetical protein VJV79_29720 [Polyangiaceae bacterium]|nr:hypothetical protein [Polyangiaceae bacterium]